MKALSLTQPWATLVAIGAKQIETRSWSTTYRGELVIHAAKGFPRWAQAICYQQPFVSALIGRALNTPADLPRGAIVAVACLYDVHTTTRLRNGPRGLKDTEAEWAFGDYSHGRYGFLLRDVRPITPIGCKGALGLWTVPDAIAQQIREELGA